ncbi:MAG: CDP-diacylglycerol--glycerol-3-phosphate 3-phosphatidyltransferase [Clostridiales bacterium]|jgi:CDP-diacylglycerol--glycerol-3-phosphate 3-phosphatidyltransferase|nr:CDP-diacylglycerol--glycerol-3-phosphate 3-phosphatidyltransferase [Clostridiales bacterium]
MNTANKLTMLRVILIPAFLVVLYIGFEGNQYVALGIFAVACLTDFADGWIARNRGQVTDFGKFMDPLADKVLVVAALLWFTQQGLVPAWAALVVIIREFAVQGLRLVAVNRGRVIAAGLSGKIKTASTMVCIILMFLPLPQQIIHICVGIIVVVTLYSGVEYFVKNKELLNWTK